MSPFATVVVVSAAAASVPTENSIAADIARDSHPLTFFMKKPPPEFKFGLLPDEFSIKLFPLERKSSSLASREKKSIIFCGYFSLFLETFSLRTNSILKITVIKWLIEIIPQKGTCSI